MQILASILCSAASNNTEPQFMVLALGFFDRNSVIIWFINAKLESKKLQVLEWTLYVEKYVYPSKTLAMYP